MTAAIVISSLIFYLVAVGLGIALGMAFILAWWWDRPCCNQDDLRSAVRAMQATERMTSAAWDARQQMHDAATQSYGEPGS